MSNACMCASTESRDPSAYDTETIRAPVSTFLPFGRLRPGSMGIYRLVHVAVSHGEDDSSQIVCMCVIRSFGETVSWMAVDTPNCAGLG